MKSYCKVKAARANKDERVRFRRAPQDIDAEEFALRYKLKRLKKGRPLDEPEGLGRSYSSASMSPPVPSAYQSPAPPAKRHQPGPPGQVAPQRPPQNGQAPCPPYQFYQPGEPPRPGSHGYGQPAPIHNYPPYSPSNGPPPGPNDKPPSAQTQQSHGPTQTTPTTQLAQRSGPAHSSPPHSADSSYNILPPPPPSSSFAPINPPTSGFAPINPPVLSSSSTPVQANVKPMPGRVPTPSVIAAKGKRTPSTTHPYTQSEAFNNRHHKCERVDALNRGIWTSYGPGGTAENPTGPKVQMYLRCSHENCLRIDWRTVHGLQCHIVKNHEQPKGTIGSLEKALDRYGVPVSEIEEHERIHGPGSGGTMADPKNTKPKPRAAPRTSEITPSVVTLGNAQVQLPGESPTPPPAVSDRNTLFIPKLSQRTSSGGFIQNDIVYSDDEEEEVGVKENNSTTQELEPPVPSVTDETAEEKAEDTAQQAPTSGLDGNNNQASSAPVSASFDEAGNEQPTTYNQAQRELQGNNESRDSDNEDSIVVKNRNIGNPKDPLEVKFKQAMRQNLHKHRETRENVIRHLTMTQETWNALPKAQKGKLERKRRYEALNYFVMEGTRLMRKAEVVGAGTKCEAYLPLRQVALDDDVYNIIKQTHECNGSIKIYEAVRRVAYGISRKEVDWFTNHCKECK